MRQWPLNSRSFSVPVSSLQVKLKSTRSGSKSFFDSGQPFGTAFTSRPQGSSDVAHLKSATSIEWAGIFSVSMCIGMKILLFLRCWQSTQ